MDPVPAPAIDGLAGLAAALGGALLIGLERERRKRSGPDREAAGIRSFTLAGLAGGLAQWLQQPALVALGALAVALLAATAYWHSRRQPGGDPGLTTELALFVTYLVGVVSVREPGLGAAAAVVVAAVLAARARLHHFATQVLSEAELHDALLLAALALVLLPLAPADAPSWMGGLSPRTLLMLTLLILSLQAAGHVALRLLGPRAGLALAGLMSGFVSSTATIAAMGARARPVRGTAAAATCEAAAMLSSAATWIQALLVLSLLAPAAARAVLPVAAVGTALALGSGLLRLRGSRAGAAGEPATPGAGPLRPREAVAVALLLGAVAVGVSWAQGRYGAGGLLAGTALAALADAHAPVAALGARCAAGAVDAALVRDATLVAVATNSVTRGITAFVAGGAPYGWRVTASLALSTTGAALTLLVLR